MGWRALWWASVVAVSACRNGASADLEPDAGDTTGDGPTSEWGALETGTSGGEDDDAPRAGGSAQWDRATLRRLTASQYAHSVSALFGIDPQGLSDVPDDLILSLFANVGASQVVSSPLAVEQYEDLAIATTGLVFADPRWRAEVTGCDPGEQGCPEDFVAAFGRSAWRRPLSVDERARYVALQQQFADPWDGARFATAALLTSPNFMHLVELGEPDPSQPTRLRYTSHEMASRLSYFLWDGPPDPELAALADAGELTRVDVVAGQARRMVDDPRARVAINRFFAQYFGLAAVDQLVKDPEVFPGASIELFADMRGEVERLVDDVVFARDGSIVDLLATRDTFVTERLASLYGVSTGTPDGAGFSTATMPEQRQGFLGTAAYLATHARVRRTSPTLRGYFVQQRLLCNELPPPPGDVDVDLPEPSDTGPAQTMREVLAEHRNNPACAGCHDAMDPLGLALEHFDGLGTYRESDGGLPLDVSGELDGMPFEDLVGLVDTLSRSPRLSDCFVRQSYRYATGTLESADEQALIDTLASVATDEDPSILHAWVAVASSRGFRLRGAEE